MTAALVENFGTWPDAAPLALEVLSDDGEYGRLYTPTSPEVTLIERQEGGGNFVIPLGFHTLEQAKRAGKVLADALAAVKEIQAEKKPGLCGLHRWRTSLFARNLTHVAVCERCGAVADLVLRDT